MDKMRMESVDLTQKNIERIYEIFPSVVTEKRGINGKIKRAVNFELLKQILADEVIEGDEAYEFTWVGKKEAMAEAGRPIKKTLRPCKEESKNWDTTENLYIEGDNLDVLKLLQESYLGKVKMIYIVMCSVLKYCSLGILGIHLIGLQEYLEKSILSSLRGCMRI